MARLITTALALLVALAFGVPVAAAQDGGSQPPPQQSDADGDGHAPPSDCNDANPSVFPGAQDKPGDGIDQDCSGADAEYQRLTTPFANHWSAGPRKTRLLRMIIKGAPAGSAVEVRCAGKGCPLKRKRVKERNGVFKAHKVVRKKLKAGARLEVRLTHPDYIGKVIRYWVRPSQLPTAALFCLPPGGKRPVSCT